MALMIDRKPDEVIVVTFPDGRTGTITMGSTSRMRGTRLFFEFPRDVEINRVELDKAPDVGDWDE